MTTMNYQLLGRSGLRVSDLCLGTMTFGNEASEPDMRAFERRFGCWVIEGYGSSEGGIAINRTPDTPEHSSSSLHDVASTT